MNDRIKLAEAMGWEPNIGRVYWRDPNDHNRFCKPSALPDPFTDANDDYAVLEWARKEWQGKDGHHGHWHQFAQAQWHRWDEYDVIVPYQIGDYARAALTVLQHQESK